MMKTANITILTVVMCGLLPLQAHAGHNGPAVQMSLQDGHAAVAWDNSISFLGEDPPYGRTLDISDAGTFSPAFRFMADSTPQHLAYSFEITTPLHYWDHLETDPGWGPTLNGEFMQVRDGVELVAVITDGVSTASPDSMAVDDAYVGGQKSTTVDESEDHLNAFFLFTPNGVGGQTASGRVGAYGFGMRIHLWQADETGNLIEDYGLSSPFFLSFRNRPVVDPLPSNGMTSGQFAEATQRGQSLVPEPATGLVLFASGLLLAVHGRRRRCEVVLNGEKIKR